MLTKEDIENIKAIRAAITPGEWFPDESWTVRAAQGIDNTPLVADTYRDEDNTFVANAPQYVDDLLEEIERLKAQIFKSNETHLEMFAEIERLKADLEGADAVALDYKKTIDRQNEYVVQMRNALTKIEALSTQWEGRARAPWWNLGDIARKALKGGER